jgi:hypothetical protein
MVFPVILRSLCSIYNILCIFFPGGCKLKQNLEGGARCKSLGTSDTESLNKTQCYSGFRYCLALDECYVTCFVLTLNMGTEIE